MRGLFVKRLMFSFNSMVVRTRSWSLPMSAPWKELVFALLMLDLKRWGVKMKSFWLWTCPLGACQVAVLDNLLGWRALARVSRWLFANSAGLHPLLFVSPMQTFLLSPSSLSTREGLVWHSDRLELQVYPSWESLLWCYQATCRTVRRPHFRGLRLVHKPEWLWYFVVSLRSRWRWVCCRWECIWWYYQQLLSEQ